MVEIRNKQWYSKITIMITLNREQVLEIAELRKQGKTRKEIASLYGVSVSSIQYWMNRLKESGYKLPNVRTGRPPINLNK